MNIQSFFMIIITAAAFENSVFTRALGINKWVQTQNNVKKILFYGGIFSWVLILTTIMNFFVMQAIENMAYARYLRPFLLLISVFIVYVITYFLIKNLRSDFLYYSQRMLPITTFNTALFAVFYIVFNRRYDLPSSIAYAIGTGIGYTIAMIIIYYAKKRLRLSPIPRSFRGTPIILLYIGLLALGFYGLLGYGVSS